MKNSVGKFLFLLLISSFLIFSCNENFSDRIQLDSGWKYSLENPDLEEVDLYLLNDVDLKNLQNLLPTREGTIYLTKTFILPSQLQKEDVSCYLGRISYSDRTYLNHYLIGSTGYDEDRRYSSGTEPRYYEIPEELLNLCSQQRIFTVKCIYWSSRCCKKCMDFRLFLELPYLSCFRICSSSCRNLLLQSVF